MALLLNNVSTDQTSSNFESNGGPALAIIVGTFDTATVTLEMATSNDIPTPRFVPLDNGAVTANAILKLDYLPSRTLVRAVVSGAGGSTANILVDILQ